MTLGCGVVCLILGRECQLVAKFLPAVKMAMYQQGRLAILGDMEIVVAREPGIIVNAFVEL